MGMGLGSGEISRSRGIWGKSAPGWRRFSTDDVVVEEPKNRGIGESRNRATVVAEKRGAERGRWVRRTTMTPTQLCDVSRLAGPPSEEPKLEANADWPHCPGRWRFIGDSTVGLVTWPPRRCPVSHTDPF